MKSREIMNAAFRAVKPTDSVLDAVKLMRDGYVHFVCVCAEDGRPLGVVNDYDVIEGVCSVDRRPSEVLVHEVMSRQFTACELDQSVDALVLALLPSGQQRALIVDEAGRLVGIVTWTDLLHYLAPMRAQKLALTHIERGFRVRGRSGSTPAPPPGSSPAPSSSTSESSESASSEAFQELLLELAAGGGEVVRQIRGQRAETLQVEPKPTP
jgi:CBS domain-containing protein